MLADLRDALRQLRKAPGFTATAVITLALGIGATTAIFTLVHQVMLKSLPVAKPEELWRIGDKIRCCNWGGYVQGEDGDFSLFSWEAYKNFRAHTPEFQDLAALQAGNAALGVRRAGSQAQVETRNGEYVSGNFFRTLGVQPWLGRLMTDEDDQEGAPPAAVMSYHIWKEKYGSDPSVVGASYQINGHPFTIIDGRQDRRCAGTIAMDLGPRSAPVGAPAAGRVRRHRGGSTHRGVRQGPPHGARRRGSACPADAGDLRSRGARAPPEWLADPADGPAIVLRVGPGAYRAESSGHRALVDVPDLATAMRELASRGIDSLLVEGGGDSPARCWPRAWSTGCIGYRPRSGWATGCRRGPVLATYR